MPAGRPTKYKPEFAEQAEKLCKLGARDDDLAEFFKVSTVTIWRWTSTYEEFCKALKVGKDEADDRVERSLFQRATGYTYDAVKIMQDKGSELIVPYQEHVPPDTTACIFWLKNRRRDEWRDRSEQTTTHDVSDPMAALLRDINQPVFPKADGDGT